MSKVPISVCIIAKNEEKYIEECLKRLQPYGFEIIVTDTGSTDRTKEIANKYADKVLDFPWINDFSAARNYCAEHASNNWILALDCDEYVSEIDLRVLRMLMQKCPKFTGVIRIKNLTYDMTGKEVYTTDDITRFYNRNYYTFLYPIHEQITAKDEAMRKEAQDAFLMPMELIHHGYALPFEELQEKQRRNLDLLYHSLEEKGEDPYTLFQIAQSELILNENVKAIEYYNKALAYEPSPDLVYVQVAIVSLAKAYAKERRFAEALQMMEKYEGKCNTAKFYFMYAGILWDNNQVLKALLYYIKVTAMDDADTLGHSLTTCYENIIEIYHELGNPQLATGFEEKLAALRRENERILHDA